MRRYLLNLSLFVIVLVLFGAVQQPQSEIIQIDGVNHRLNNRPVNGSVPGEIITAEDVLVIDGTGPGFPDEAMLLSPQDVICGPNGEIVVLEDQQVKMFDDQGNFIRAFGREGNGPGEFQMSVHFLPIQPDLIAVAEGYAGWIHIFNFQGEFIERITLARRSSAFTIPARNGGYFAYDSSVEILGSDRVQHKFIRRLDEHGQRIPFTTANGDLDSLWISTQRTGEDYINPGCRLIPSPSGNAYSTGTRYTIYKFNEDGIHSAFRRVADDVRLPRWFRQSYVGRLNNRGQPTELTDVPTKGRVSPGGIVVDETGHIWVSNASDGTQFHYARSMRSLNKLCILPIDQFDPEGRWLRHWVIEIPIPTSLFIPTQAVGGYLYGYLHSRDDSRGNPVIRFKRPQ